MFGKTHVRIGYLSKEDAVNSLLQAMRTEPCIFIHWLMNLAKYWMECVTVFETYICCQVVTVSPLRTVRGFRQSSVVLVSERSDARIQKNYLPQMPNADYLKIAICQFVMVMCTRLR